MALKKLGVCVQVIPHDKQRYQTVGDWWLDRQTGILEVRVSELGNWKMEMAIASHELHEAILCLARGIKEEDITQFDMAYEAKRIAGDFSEPGDSIDAPYKREHQFATVVEQFLINELQIDWEKYEKTVNAL